MAPHAMSWLASTTVRGVTNALLWILTGIRDCLTAYARKMRKGKHIAGWKSRTNIGGGGGNRTRVRKHYSQASTCVSRLFGFRIPACRQAGLLVSYLLNLSPELRESTGGILLYDALFSAQEPLKERAAIC
jgi:hypothetical protein